MKILIILFAILFAIEMIAIILSLIKHGATEIKEMENKMPRKSKNINCDFGNDNPVLGQPFLYQKRKNDLEKYWMSNKIKTTK